MDALMHEILRSVGMILVAVYGARAFWFDRVKTDRVAAAYNIAWTAAFLALLALMK